MRTGRQCINCGEFLTAGEVEVCELCLEPDLQERFSDNYETSVDKNPNRRQENNGRTEVHS